MATNTPESRRPRTDLRSAVQYAGIGVTTILALAMLLFVLASWLRDVPAFGTIYQQYLILGMWIDYWLGTNVFRLALTWRSLSMGVLIGIIAPMVGTFLVHRQMALIGETLAHTAFAGVAIGFVAAAIVGSNLWFYELNPLHVALVVSILGALGVQWLADRTDVYGDVPIAIMLTGSFAVGTIVINVGPGQPGFGIEDYLWGDLSIVTTGGARMVALFSVLVVAAIALTYRQLLFITFDEQAARVARINVDFYNTLLVVMTAVVVVGAMQVLGVILVAGMLVIPVAAASQLARGFHEAMTLSILFGQLSVIGGFALAIWQRLPTGGSIIVVAVALYLLTIFATGRSVRALSTH